MPTASADPLAAAGCYACAAPSSGARPDDLLSGSIRGLFFLSPVTGVTGGKAYFQSYSMDVLIEGENVPRALDLCTHNHLGATGNTPPWPWAAPAQPALVPQEKAAYRFVRQPPFNT